ncbi:MAG TPA: helix-turn-helix domain-containing protein, partial [Novosphingobium sp.]|nr:helix-turn-helix domain-containing protein [Novosphingobium sp.]
EPQGPAARHRQLPEDAAQAARLGWVLADLAAAPAGDGQGAIDPVAMAELALALALVDSLLAGGGQLGGERVSRHEELVARFRRLVEVHFRQGWAVERYAASLATTAPTLTRACRGVLGRAPGEVVLDRLLLEAMRSLTYTSASVSQIAEALGFADPAYFARFFKARAGVTASAFRADRGWLGAVPG